VACVTVNAEQAEDWNGASGQEFIDQRERFERMLGRLKARLLSAARIQDGDKVLDVGCGCGDVTIAAARAAGGGHAVGADFSRIQVAEARRLAACAGVANARFEVVDVQAHPFAVLGLMHSSAPIWALVRPRASSLSTDSSRSVSP
jgi:SAM-dependent methyltransferase